MNASRLVSSPTLQGLRHLSRRAWWLHALLIGQLALLPCPLSRGVWVELDTDGDGLIDSGYEDGVAEASAEGEPAIAEPDADGDGLSDTDETACGSDPCNPDSDYDGLTDADEARLTGTSPVLADSDGDGITDYNAFYGNPAVDTLWAGEGATPYDWDGDGLHDPVDPDPFSAQNIGDADGDHVPDPEDSHPLDPALWCDGNGNGVNDDAEAEGNDLDADGVSDATDSHPADPALDNDWNANGTDDEHEDGDGDGVSNLQDSHPNANTLWCDWNGNGVNDDAEAAVAAGEELAGSTGAAEPEEADGSGEVLQDFDGDGYADDHDSHPVDAGLWNDHNGNGLNDDTEAPPDTDRDGIADAWDAAPADQDNDGLSDVEEWTQGTHPAAVDSDGDGLGDGEEVHAGTDPRSLDTDGDGLTDSEELFAYHSDPLEPTAIALAESGPLPEVEQAPASGGSGLKVSQVLPDPGSETGQRRADHPDGGSLAFPSRSAHRDKSDLTKTLLLACTGETPLTGLRAYLSGPDAAHFQLGQLSGDDLAPGTERAVTVSFLAPASATSARTAVLTFEGGPADTPLFVLNLRSVVSSGLWTTHDEYFFADYTDSDGDGIPDLVEDMYAPLTVTATGDLDGDGVNNLDQYLAGKDLRAHTQSNDVDGDGLTNATEDAWNAAYPGKLNKFYFADAFADPDGDGLLTIEELTCTWGGQKDPLAVATHPFVAGSPPPSASKTATYKTAGRKPPKTPPPAADAQTFNGPLLSRCSRYAAWMNDGHLRRASHETARANGGRLPADFFVPEDVVHAATLTLQSLQGSDHLPRGYLLWLGRQTPALTPPTPVPAAPDSEALQSQLLGLQLPEAPDADADMLDTAWEAAYDLNWRSAADSHLDYAIETLDQRIARLAVDLADPIRSAEHDAVVEVRNRFVAARTSWPVITYPATVQGQPATVQTQLMPVYGIDHVKFPASLTAAAAADGDRRSSWIVQYTAALDWQMRTALDPDHDGLMNRDESQLGLSPRLPDYDATGERDSDGDGFIDAIEHVTGTDHLNARKRPVYAIKILTPKNERTGTTLLPLAVPLQTVLSGPKGTWPLAAQSMNVRAPDHQCLLAWQQDAAALDWHPKTAPAVLTDDQGRITLQVHPGWKAGGLRLTLHSAPGIGLPAGLKPDRVVCELKIAAPDEDSDTDGLPDAWEARAAQGPGDPAHRLNKASALDAEAGPQHFGYHPATPPERLPAVVQALLNEWKAAEADLGYLPEYPATTATATTLAVPTTEEATVAARYKILALIDPDHDGWSNRVEFENGTHPRVPDNVATAARDTDGDGIADVLELDEGTNPHDAGSVPVANLADAGLKVVWGNGQKAAPGTLAPQPVAIQVVSANGVLLKRVALKASCAGGHFAVPAATERNVQWQANELPLVTDAHGKAVFHFWTPPDTAAQWQVRVALTAHPAIQASVQIHNAGSGGSGTTSGGGTGGRPGVGDRRPSAGDNPGFNNSHAPFVIRFVDWKSGIVGNERSNPDGGSGGEAYEASKQGMHWELGGNGAPGKVPDGTPYAESIGSHTAQSAYAWMKEWNRAASQPYTMRRHTVQWIEGATDNGVYTESYRVQNGAEQLQSRSLKQSFGSEEEYHSYMNAPHADEYEVGGGSWLEVLTVYPAEQKPSGTGSDPTGQPQATTKHYYQQQVPQTFSTLANGIDTARQVITGPVGMLNALGATIRLEDKRLPNGQRKLANGEHDWDGIVASAALQLNKTAPGEAGEPPAYSGSRSEGKVVIAWDSEYPVSLSEKSREAWLKRFLVLITRADGTDSLQPLSDYLSLTSGGDSAPIELNPGLLNDETTPEKSVTLRLLPIDLAIDANRDGSIDQGETASEDKPLRFWINNDSDSGATYKEEEGSAPDYQDDTIDNVRDLEDFQMLKVGIPDKIFEKIHQKQVKIGLRWKSISAGSPSIKVYRPTPTTYRSQDYIWNLEKAKEQAGTYRISDRYSKTIATVSGSYITWLPDDALLWVVGGVTLGTQHPYLMFEASGKGVGQLCLVVQSEGGVDVDGLGVWLKLMDVQEMFASAQGEPGMPYPNPPEHINDEPPRPTTGYENINWPGRGQFVQDPDEADEAIILVHGWNMTDGDWRVFSSSFFKRLWWKGYKGRFYTFGWPTYNSEHDTLGFLPAHYNKSEYVAWKYGPALKALVDGIPKKSKNVAAHSMGNVVMASALKSGLTVNSYVAMQAALPAGCYDASDSANNYLKFKQAEQRKKTPEQAATDLGYRGLMAGIPTGNFHNFFSANDYALKTGTILGGSVSWEGNQINYKPNGWGNLYYDYDSAALNGQRNQLWRAGNGPGGHVIARYATDHHESMSFIARPHSEALGARAEATAGFEGFDLTEEIPAYGFGTTRTEHSGQFQRPIQITEVFYKILLRKMRLNFNDNN